MQIANVSLANKSCVYCKGSGTRFVYSKHPKDCNCVYRKIFHICLAKFRYISVCTGAKAITWNFQTNCTTVRSFAMAEENFLADFVLIAKRYLTEVNYKIFLLYHTLGLSWKSVCRKVKITRDNLFRTVYLIEKTLGKIYCTLKPYGLYPVDDYFSVRG